MRFRITMSFTPPLLAMWADPLLRQRYVLHLDRLIDLAEKEVRRTRWQPAFQRLVPSLSIWGCGGYDDVLLNGSNDWLYRHLHKMAERMEESARVHPWADSRERRALKQMARELLLAQTSIWVFILKTQTHPEYAGRRVRDHVARFTTLYDQVQGGRIDEEAHSGMEARDSLFPSVDCRVYAHDPARQ